MEPENFTFMGFVILIAGFLSAGFGGLFFGQVYFCILNSTTCSIASADAATRIGYAIPLLIFGSFLITTGAIFTAAGHITEHLRPVEASGEESEDEPIKPALMVCVKCSRQVDPTASYCPTCGTQLTK